MKGAHLWVILSDPKMHPECVVVVNLTTHHGQPWEDRSCILQPGDHSFITHETIVLYARAKIETKAELERRFANNTLEFHDDASAELLQKIAIGAAKTNRLAGEIKNAMVLQKII